MDKQKKALMTKTYRQFMEIGLGKRDKSSLQQIVDERIVGFGTAIDEKILGIEGLLKLLKLQNVQSEGFELSWRIDPISHYTTEDEQTAVFADELYLTIKSGEESIEMYLRFSVVLSYANGQWKVIHWHGSKPEQVESQKDTWGLDLWKEEAEKLQRLVSEKTADLVEKNRELEIEAALERVRSTSLAMHTSQDLSKVVYVVFTELVKLDAQLDRCLILTVNPETSGITWYLTGKEGLLSNNGFFVEDNPHPSHQAYLEGWRTKRKKWHYLLAGEEKKSWDAYGFSQTGLTQLPDFIKADMAAVEAIHLSISSDDFGCLIASSLSPLSDAHSAIVERFSIVFNQTYTRFLDLKKAEAQTREAQIEAALERVRSRSMAMHKSEELKEVIRVVLEQFVQLNMNVGHAGFYIDYKAHDDMHIWLADPNIEPFFAILPYFNTPTWNSFLEAKAKGITLHTDLLDFETKNQFYSSLFELFTVPEEAKKFYLACKGLAVSTVLLDTVGLYIENFDAVPYTDEENNILIRFGKVFQQTYTRFLDLQRAEAQAREAQIEAALERVRSRAMAMHSSNELNEVVHELRKQMGILGQKNLETCVIHLHDESHEYIQSWAGIKPPDEEGDILESIANVPKRGLTIIEEALDAYNSNLLDYVLLNEGEKLRQWFSFLEKEAPEGFSKLVDSVHGNIEELRSYWSFADFSGGSLLMVTREEPAEPTRGLLRRFSNVFGLAFRRFADLKQAEAQAREAQIEAALEKVRSRSLAMQKPEELVEVAELLRGEMGRLGVEELETSSIYLVDSENMQAECWYAIKDIRDGDKMLVSDEMTLLLPDTWVGREMWKFFQSKKEQTSIAMKGDKRKEWINYCADKSQVLQGYYGNEIPERTYHLVKFNGGYLGAASPGEISQASWDLLKRAAAVFSFAYTRFKDLQDAAARAREAQIELAMEKVRGRTMAMQSSDELADAAYVLFEQLKSLGVTHERINIGIVNEENQTIDFWITEQGGDKLSSKFSGRISEPTTLSIAYAAWKNGEKSLMVDLRGEELKSWLSYLNDEIKIPFNKAFLHDRRVQTAGFFSKGMLIVTSPEPLQQEALYLLEKFAGVFDLTYTRFNDLKVAEAHALQAEKDLVEIKIARQKAEDALTELKSTQAQLIQQEKLASLGQLTAGIAHEIKNPLNFVNNFSEVTLELVGEIREERSKNQESRDESLVDEILEDIQSNLQKIHEHGSRANGIVTSMLQHSRGGSGKKEPTDLNALIKEYVNLSFHGMRAGKNPINVDIILDLDPDIKEVSLIKEDFTRVIINLCNNAFDAMRSKTNSEFIIHNSELYHPKLSISTKAEKDFILIEVADNGPGIPEEIRDKILQPFFTTKKGTEGTGLGLSITHDIVKAHGGKLSLQSQVGEGTCFLVTLPTLDKPNEL